MQIDGDAEGVIGRGWSVLEAKEAAERAALAHIELADGLWHRAGAGPAALAHRLAASVLYSFLGDDSRQWRLSPVVRDILTLGDSAVPDTVEALETAMSQTSCVGFSALIKGLAGDSGVADERLGAVIGLARTAAREIAALP